MSSGGAHAHLVKETQLMPPFVLYGESRGWIPPRGRRELPDLAQLVEDRESVTGPRFPYWAFTMFLHWWAGAGRAHAQAGRAS